LASINDETIIQEWNQVLLARIAESSPLYRMLEVVASGHMGSMAIAHLEEKNGKNISWVSDSKVVDTYAGEHDIAALDCRVRDRLLLSEDLHASKTADDGSVIVVGKTFESQVPRPDVDVMLIVYAPLCGFSRKALPLWAEFAPLVASKLL